MKGKWKLEFSTEERYKASCYTRIQTPPSILSLHGDRSGVQKKTKEAVLIPCGTSVQWSPPACLCTFSRT